MHFVADEYIAVMKACWFITTW